MSSRSMSGDVPIGDVTHTARATRRRKLIRQGVRDAATLFILCCGACLALAPVLWMFSTSLKTLNETQVFPPQWLPSSAHWDNYTTALTVLPFATYFRNSAFITLTIMVGEVLSNSFVAYGFARLRAPGRNVLFILVLSTMLIPYPVIMIPQYILFKNLNWIDTFLPLIVPPCFGSAYLIFLMRQFYLTIPREMDDAAEIDGCSYFGIYRRIMLPMAKPALVTVAIFSFTYNWNDYLAPLIYINSQSNYTLTLGLANFLGRYNPISWNWIMAASLVAALPCIVIFFFAQRFFIQGVVVSGVKG